ncbi:TonB-dependent receptor [Echinicola vietnamensis]|uniref:Outer membrane receptor protein n=1 Tax=Echinicola vietnamensis (strain DSM 17526 / LMG 23754 / KMM 6221) TaxID=926556 RepID=L0FX92_ECHVK|nr:TonB-dependent receptor [Echinicola vietnamensis]AGA77275.1 outer membrane receptor protein [Echinicola vietnamensis DSM 17526]
MKTLLLIAAWLLTGICAMAQHQLTGTVKDAETGEPLIGANVILEGTGRGATADLNGTFTIKNVPSGNYQLKVSYVGYEAHVQTVEAQSPRLEILLEPNALLTEEFIVSATRASETTPTTFSTVTKEDIAKNNLGQDIPFLLNNTPSVVTNSDAGAGIGYTGLRIRGSDQTRINVTVNGIPLNDAESHGVFWVNMPDFASSVDNIQIQRGVGTSTNGAATFGASMNIQTDTKKEEAYGEVATSFGSFNSQKYTVQAGSGLLNDRWAVDARLSQIKSDGYVDRASSDLKSYFLSGGYYGDNHVFKVNVFSGKEKTYQAWYGLPEDKLETDRTFNYYTYDNETDNYQQDHYQFIYTGKYGQNWKAHAALHYTYGRGYYEQFREDDDYASYGLDPVVIGNETIESTDIIRRRWLDNDFFGGVFSLNYVSDDGRWDVILGGGANRYDGDHFGEIIWARIAGETDIRDRYYDNNAVKDDRNIYAKATYEVADRLYLFGDLQFRQIDYRFKGINDDRRIVDGAQHYDFFNPKVGISYESGKGETWYASYAVANREPVRSDFTDNPITEIPRPERLHNVEAGIRAQKGNVSYSANFYYMGYKDQLILTGQINDVGAYIRENVDNSYRAGIELDGAVKLSPKWTLGGNIAFSRNKIDTFTEYVDDYSTEEFQQESFTYEDTDIAFSPNIVGSAMLDFHPVKNMEISWVAKYVDDQYLDNTQNDGRKLDAFFTNDIRFAYTLRPRFLRALEFNVKVNNVFDVMYEPNGYTFSYFVPGGAGKELVTENYYYPMAGTNFMAGVNVKF